METKKLTCCDLMVGDWVSIDNILHKVTGIQICDGIMCVQTDYTDTYYSIENYKPIPLTAEVLEKNGFELYNQDFTSCRVYKFGCFDYIECNDYHEDSRYNYFSIGCYIEYKHFGTLQRYIHDVMKIRYVHELQHALRLCGINDKEIVL